MLEAPRKEHLPTHSREVCPWGKTCSVHHREPVFDAHAGLEYQRARRLTA